MVKIVKIKDLDEDVTLAPVEKEELNRREMDNKISIDDLSEDFSKEVSPIITKTEVSTPKQVPVKESRIFFKRNIIHAYFSKTFSFCVVLFYIDLTLHLLKILDGVAIFQVENFHSIYFGGNIKWVISRIGVFFITMYLLTPKEDITINKKGIYCQKTDLLNSIFFTTSEIFLHFENIVEVEHKLRFFEPYLFFYGKDDVKLGHIEFSINSREKFFNFIKDHAGTDHPLAKIQKNISSF